MRPSTWRGVVAIVLAAGVTSAVIIIAIETILHIGPVSESESTLLATVLGAAVGAVATFLGGSHDTGPGPSSSSSPAEAGKDTGIHTGPAAPKGEPPGADGV